MKTTHITKTGQRGWFVGDFPEAAVSTSAAEVCYKVEPAGKMAAHYHQRCWETVLIVEGIITCQGNEYHSGDILVFEPGDINDIECLVETKMIGVKTPAGGNDKVYV